MTDLNTETSYKLPLPESRQETARLDMQHQLVMAYAGDIYPASAKDAITSALTRRDANGGQPAILDVGSGSGTWLVTMAQRFPDASCLGIDISPKHPKVDLSNLRFFKGDATKCLDDYTCKFDVVHCRTVLTHIDDVPSLMQKMTKCLRSGGVIVLDHPGESRRVDEHAQVESWTLKFLYAAMYAFKAVPFFGEQTKALIEGNKELRLGECEDYWISTNWVDPNDPLKPQKQRFLSETSKQYYSECFESLSPVVKKAGWSEETLSIARQKMGEEVESGYPKSSFMIARAWAVKN